MVKYALGYYEHEVFEEAHALDADGQRYFGLLKLRSTYGDYTDTVGLRNSHDKKFKIGVAFGSCVHVCSNLAFSGSHVIARKHSANSRRELPALLAEIVEPLKEQRLLQHQGFERYKHTPLTIDAADHLVIEAYRKGIVNLQRIPDVLEQFERPAHDWGAPTAWRFFNATTYAISGKVAEAPDLTTRLHELVDGYCEVIH